MKDRLRKAIITRYFEIVEKNIKFGNYVETDFRHYSELVKTLVETIESLDNSFNKQNRIFFTGLCLPLFQWFNFNVDPPTALNLRKVKIMQCDPIWVAYLKFVKDKLKNLNLHRCILCADEKVTINKKFRLVPIEALKKQSEYNIIYKSNNPLEPLKRNEIENILDALKDTYICYNQSEAAFLIVDSSVSHTSNQFDSYEIENVKTFFMDQFHNAGKIHRCILDQNEYDAWVVKKKLPEDFFIVGTGDLDKHEWELALAADVIDFEKVRLWYVAGGMDALEKGIDGNYKTRFTFQSLTEFVDFITKNIKPI